MIVGRGRHDPPPDDEHYWVGTDEVEKLLRRGEGWLGGHPQCGQIVSRYLKRQHGLAREALGQLLEEDQPETEAFASPAVAMPDDDADETISLNQQRLGAVAAVLKGSGAKRVLDLGCGVGRRRGPTVWIHGGFSAGGAAGRGNGAAHADGSVQTWMKCCPII